jgi:hypothetical protein
VPNLRGRESNWEGTWLETEEVAGCAADWGDVTELG